MREFSVEEIKLYGNRCQAAACFAATINGLCGLVGHDIFSSEENEQLAALDAAIRQLDKYNNARIEVTEQAMEKFKTVNPSRRAMVNLVSLLEGIKKELETETAPTVPIHDENNFGARYEDAI